MPAKNYKVISPSMYRIQDLPLIETRLCPLDLIRANFDPEKFCSHALTEFETAVFGNDIGFHVQFLSDAGDMSVSKNWEDCIESFKIVKAARKLAEALGCVMMFVDANHKQPKVLKQFNDTMGEFKDRVVHDYKRKNSAPVFEAIDKMRSVGLPLLNPASYTSFLGVYNRVLGEISDFYCADDMTLREHHKLRVRVRTFYYFYNAVGKSTGLSVFLDLANYLSIVASEMGKTQDRIYALKLKKKVDEEKDRVCLNETHREIIGNFLRLHGK